MILTLLHCLCCHSGICAPTITYIYITFSLIKCSLISNSHPETPLPINLNANNILPPIDSELSDASDLDQAIPSESLTDRLLALRDIIPPKTRTRLSSATTSVYNFSSSCVNFSGKALWIVSTSVMLLGIPWALAVGQEQELMEQEREANMYKEGAGAMLDAGGQPGTGGTKAAS